MQKQGPYIVLTTDGTDTKLRTLNSREWTVVQQLFKKHSKLMEIICVDRVYPEVKEDGQK